MIKTPKHLAFILKFELADIEKILLNIDSYYYEKVEVKMDKEGNPKLKNGVIQKRILYPSIDRLKVLQKKILQLLLSELKMPDYAYGAMRGKDNVMNARRHQGKKYIFTTDLKSFFPSISHRKVFQMYLSFGFSHTVARILTKLTTYKGMVPQGAPTSPMVANLVFIRTGDKLQSFATEHGLTFTTFIDDLTFSAPADFQSKAPLIIQQIQADGFKISYNKTNYKTKFPIVTGVVVKNNKLSLTPAFKIKLKTTEGFTKEKISGLKQYAVKVSRANT